MIHSVASAATFAAKSMRPHRLAWSRTPPFHGGDTGSNPVGAAIFLSPRFQLSCRFYHFMMYRHHNLWYPDLDTNKTALLQYGIPEAY